MFCMLVCFSYLSISRTFSSCPPREMTSFAVCERRKPLSTNFQFLLAFSTKLLIFGSQITWKKPRNNCCRLRGCLGPVHTKTIVNANDSKRKLFYAFRPSVHTKTMKTLTIVCVYNRLRVDGALSSLFISWLEERQITECHRRWQRHKLLRMWLVEWGSISVLHVRHALCNNHVSSSYKRATRNYYVWSFYDNLRIQPYIFNSLCSIQRCALSGRGCTSLTL